MIDINRPLVFVTEEGKEYESILRAARIGYENVKGYLKGGITAWVNDGNPMDKIQSITPQEFAHKIIPIAIGTGKKNPETSSGQVILDVRRPGEFETAHVKNAEHIELAALPSNLNSLDKKRNYLVHCAGGYRSMIASSIMKANGFENVVNIYGGFGQIKNTDTPIEVSAETTV